jgi:hypothetical protein
VPASHHRHSSRSPAARSLGKFGKNILPFLCRPDVGDLRVDDNATQLRYGPARSFHLNVEEALLRMQ